MTGYQEADNFRKHLNRCGKTPAKAVCKALSKEEGVSYYPAGYDIHDALEIRANSGQ